MVAVTDAASDAAAAIKSAGTIIIKIGIISYTILISIQKFRIIQGKCIFIV